MYKEKYKEYRNLELINMPHVVILGAGVSLAASPNGDKNNKKLPQEVKDSILLEVTDAFQRLEVSEKNIQTAMEALVQAKENFRLTNLQYRDGITTSTEVLDARTFLTQAEMNHHNTIYGYRIAEAELKRAVGKK